MHWMQLIHSLQDSIGFHPGYIGMIRIMLIKVVVTLLVARIGFDEKYHNDQRSSRDFNSECIEIILLDHSLLRSTSRTTSPIRHSRKQTRSPFECPMQTRLGPIIHILTPHVHGSNRNTGGESGDHDGGYCPCGRVDEVGIPLPPPPPVASLLDISY